MNYEPDARKFQGKGRTVVRPYMSSESLIPTDSFYSADYFSNTSFCTAE